MDDQEFQTQAAAAMEDLDRRLSAASDRYGFDADFNSGAMSIEFDDPPAKFVVSPNSPVRQIWVSAHSQSFKLDWDPARGAFVLSSTGDTLAEMIAKAIERQLGEAVSF